jgi:hypothetical protein
MLVTQKRGCEKTNEYDRAWKLWDDKGGDPRDPADAEGEEKKDTGVVQP